MAFDALSAGQGACIALNAANEVAVDAFLHERLPYTGISSVIARTLEWHAGRPSVTLGHLDDVLAADAAARAQAERSVPACR